MVSVIIPLYNRYHLVKEAIESVLTQSFQDFELIIADDGSSDGAASLVEEYPQIRYLQMEHTGFPGLVRNRGAELARGRWLAFLDSDDLFEPDKLSKQIDMLDSCEGQVIHHTRERWLRGSKIISQKQFNHKRSGDVFDEALRKCMIGPSTVVMDREMYTSLGGFREDLEIAEDYEFWLRVTALYPVSYCDDELITKRAGHGSQLSEKYGQIEIFRIRGLEDLVRQNWFTTHATVSHQCRALAELSRKCLIYSRGAAKRGRADISRTYLTLHERYKHESEALG
jgi:glycosyltransferase involved in cell wall biosynthesis